METPQHPAALLSARMRRNWPEAATRAMAITLAVHRLSRLSQDIARAQIAPFDLTMTEFEVLSALRSWPAPHRATPSQLYDALLISSGGLTKVLKGLTERGLIDRPASEGDGRSRPIALTAAGRTLIAATMAAVQAAEAPAFAQATPELEAALEALIAGLEGVGGQPPTRPQD